MIDVNWDLAPEGADRVVVRFYNGDEMSCKKVIQRPTQKTVADAVEYYERAWPDEKDSVCVWDDKRKKFEFWISDYEPVSYCYEVCNYEQFEAYVKEQKQPNFKATRENLEKIAKDTKGGFVEVEQEGEKWTHEYNSANIKCRILATVGDDCWVLTEYGNKATERMDSLKPIKPTISESRALELMKTMCPDEWAALDRKYDII